MWLASGRKTHTSWVVGQTQSLAQILPSVFANMAGRLKNLFFAGEVTHADLYGFIQGGYYSGLERANDIAGCIQGGKCQPYEPSTGLPVIVKTQDCKPKSEAPQIAVLNVISLFIGLPFTWLF